MSGWLKTALLAALAVVLVGAAGCGETEHDELVEGETFELGELRYNVVFTRFLNPADEVDRDYLTGLPPPPAGKQYLGVFLLIDNLSDEPHPLPAADDLEIADTSGATYKPLPSESLFSFPFGGTVEGDSEVPDPDTAAAKGPTQGSVLLYLVDEGITEERPADLKIISEGEEAIVELDL